MDLEFCDISYTVNRSWRDKGHGRTILHGVSGCFRSGQLSAIMGPSGAGKSTLLNILSGYRTAGVKGSLKINGKPLNRRSFHKSSRYITQEDLLPPLLTTKEAMMIAANLKLPSSTTHKQKDMMVEETLSMLGLSETVDTRTEMLSGGQKKRLSIALEMINNPSVFFLDEPTSGLDNVSTMQCIKLLSKVAQQGKTIVCTIHQPSASLFELFDNVYVLGRGRCVYQGATLQLIPFMSSAGFLCPTYHNPADFVIEVTDSDDKNIAILSKAIENGRVSHSTPKQIADKIENFEKEKEEEEKIKDMSRQSSNVSDGTVADCNLMGYHRLIVKIKDEKDGFEQDCETGSYPITGCEQFVILTKRMFKQILRNRVALRTLFLHHLLCALLVGFVFYNTANDANQMFNHLKFCVGYVLFHTYTNIMMPVLVYPTEVKLLKKEYFNRWYGLNPYFAAQLLSKLPTQIIFGMIFNTFIYFLCGLPRETLRFSLFSLVGLLVIFVSDAVGMAIGSIFNVTNGSAVGPAVVAPFLGLACYGFDFARQVSWLTYAIMKLSFMRNAVVATAITLFSFGRKTLECNVVYCHFKEPRLVLDFLDVEHVSVWSEIFAICVLLLFFRVVSYCALRNRLFVR